MITGKLTFVGLLFLILSLASCGNEGGQSGGEFSPFLSFDEADNRQQENIAEPGQAISKPIIVNLKSDDRSVTFDITQDGKSQMPVQYSIFRWHGNAKASDMSENYFVYENIQNTHFIDDTVTEGVYIYQVRAHFGDSGSSLYADSSKSAQVAISPIPESENDTVFETPAHTTELGWNNDSYSVNLKTEFSDLTYFESATLTVKNRYIQASTVNDIKVSITKEHLHTSNTTVWETDAVTIPNSGYYDFTVTATYNYKGTVYKQKVTTGKGFPIRYDQTLAKPIVMSTIQPNTDPGTARLSIRRGDQYNTNFRYFRVERKLAHQGNSEYVFRKNTQIIPILVPSYLFEESGLVEEEYYYRAYPVYDIDGLLHYGPSQDILVTLNK